MSSKVYLGFVCHCGFASGFIFRLPLAAPCVSWSCTAATCRLPYWVSGCSSFLLPQFSWLFCWLLLLLLLLLLLWLFSLRSCRMSPWFPASVDCAAPCPCTTPPASSKIGSIAESGTANALAIFMSS